MKLEGVYVANVTPFGPGGELDLEALDRHLEFLAGAGVHGFVPCGTTGEGSSLTSEERRKVLELSRSIADRGNLRVIAGCGSNATSRVLELIDEAHGLGSDAALVVAPYYNKPTAQGLLAHYEFLAERAALPIVLYNVPSRTGVNLTPDLVSRLFQHEKIIGIKEASGNYGQWLGLTCATEGQGKAVLAGDDDAFAAIQSLGGAGIISACANVAPAQFVRLYDLTRSGDWEGAYRAQKNLFPLVRALFLETNPAPVKYALELIHSIPGHLRLPLVGIGESTSLAIRTALGGLEAS